MGAQEATRTLTLEEALDLAVMNNPTYLSQTNDQAPADWSVRESYAQFLPQFNVGGGLRYTAAGVQTFGVFTSGDIGAGSTDYYLSDYFAQLNWSLSGQTLFAPGSAKADQKATGARIRASRFDLESLVTLQYTGALLAREAVDVARQQLDRALENYEIVQARVDAGAAVSTDAKSAEVEWGRAKVTVLEAENLYRSTVSQLMETLGIPMREDIELEGAFEVFELEASRDELIVMAMDLHPSLESFRANESARRADVRAAKSQYFPTLSASATWSGFTRQIGNEQFLLGQVQDGVNGAMASCEQLNAISAGLTTPLEGYPRNCGAMALTPEAEAAILSNNAAFPFNFTAQPLNLSLRVSLPVFNGLTRQRQVEQANAQLSDAAHARRAEELRLRTAVTQSYDNLQTEYQVLEIEERNLEVAGEQLELAQERYRLGAAAYLELLDAQSNLAAAERDYLTAMFEFHQAMAQLESATGTRLRPGFPGNDDQDAAQQD
jgi:outer membrane protein